MQQETEKIIQSEKLLPDNDEFVAAFSHIIDQTLEMT